MDKRSSGILLHITSLPSPFGIGDMGGEAFKFIDFLAETEQTYWQVLPLNPISLISGSSPYASFSAFAGNTLLISPEGLLQMDLLQQDDIDNYPQLAEDSVNYGRVLTEKKHLYGKAFHQFMEHPEKYRHDYSEFCQQNTGEGQVN